MGDYSKIGFKYNASDNGETLVTSVTIKDVKADNVIFSKYDLELTNNKTFMYNIMEDSYSIDLEIILISPKKHLNQILHLN